MPFHPNYRITDRAATYLMRIGAARQAVEDLPITAAVLAGLRETARRFSTYYSTRIEGNRLTQEEVSSVIERQGSIPGRESDEAEVLGYYAALKRMERFAAQGGGVTDLQVRTLDALVMAGGKAVKKASALSKLKRRVDGGDPHVRAGSVSDGRFKIYDLPSLTGLLKNSEASAVQYVYTVSALAFSASKSYLSATFQNLDAYTRSRSE